MCGLSRLSLCLNVFFHHVVVQQLFSLVVLFPRLAVLAQNSACLARLQLGNFDLAQPVVSTLDQLLVVVSLLHKLDRVGQFLVLVFDLDFVLLLRCVLQSLDRVPRVADSLLLFVLLVELVLEVSGKVALFRLRHLQVVLQLVKHFLDVAGGVFE